MCARCVFCVGRASLYRWPIRLPRAEKRAKRQVCNTATVHGWVSKKELNITKVSEGVFSVTPDVCGQIPNVVKWVPSSDEETLSKQCGGQTVKIQHHEDPGHVHLEVTVEDCVHEVRSAIVIIYDVCCVRG